MRLLPVLLSLLIAFCVHAAPPTGHPGGVVRLDLGPRDSPPPRVRFAGSRAMVYPEGGRWIALLGVPLDAEPGWLGADIEGPDGGAHSIPLTIDPFEYPAQRLNVNRRHVNPDPEELARYEREQQEQDAAKAAWRDVEPRPPRLQLPVQGRRSSAFGLRRIFNGEPRRPHSGVDLAVPTGTPVAAPADGTVTLVGDYFFNGRTIFIDHGQGLISMLCHLSRVEVGTGQVVRSGQRIGRAGATGRATGPHVHWSVFLNGTAVDPDAVMAAAGLSPGR